MWAGSSTSCFFGLLAHRTCQPSSPAPASAPAPAPTITTAPAHTEGSSPHSSWLPRVAYMSPCPFAHKPTGSSCYQRPGSHPPSAHSLQSCQQTTCPASQPASQPLAAWFVGSCVCGLDWQIAPSRSRLPPESRVSEGGGQWTRERGPIVVVAVYTHAMHGDAKKESPNLPRERKLRRSRAVLHSTVSTSVLTAWGAITAPGARVSVSRTSVSSINRLVESSQAHDTTLRSPKTLPGCPPPPRGAVAMQIDQGQDQGQAWRLTD